MIDNVESVLIDNAGSRKCLVKDWYFWPSRSKKEGASKSIFYQNGQHGCNGPS